MSGHSKWSTIKRQKGVRDIERGKVFSKLARAISIAVRAGKSSDPSANPKLRVAIEHARALNMPKDNIQRAISRGSGERKEFEEISYEGFGPSGVAVIVEAATDNRNRTGQEIKNIFERVGGNLVGPAAVSFNFEPRGLIVVKKEKDSEEQMLKLIDAQVEDIDETGDALEIYVSPGNLADSCNTLKNLGFSIISSELVKKPKNLQTIEDRKTAEKLLNFLDSLENHEDVQKVYANFDIPQEVLSGI
ncbi:hypothetical protein A2686_02650 [Candidatus Woesebacteria bacterium RIFCSPHIGHO2_01_FULL_38_10]|uniref:Probable transcriptional regulatory protein A2892_00340 n=1 Tax=Candidatus Woesebacteria bacterium RIFCSPLOWO2_01_FULL_39_10b TaxID=1802517 RepID=A0A1F8B8X0_9BACT|nr:MAG: hypothetical protein A2686_02650 [Candidatus Woesebacteria bacterium RIFCSPHIGHO2_01_FULL_38_10]OGM60467.1 MAG: hypothetical protein A2892_00340 [Candidatus Woesebacteria bacterium RIFCSPLOWO2_01_FULL_39_10b]